MTRSGLFLLSLFEKTTNKKQKIGGDFFPKFEFLQRRILKRLLLFFPSISYSDCTLGTQTYVTEFNKVLGAHIMVDHKIIIIFIFYKYICKLSSNAQCLVNLFILYPKVSILIFLMTEFYQFHLSCKRSMRFLGDQNICSHKHSCF